MEGVSVPHIGEVVAGGRDAATDDRRVVAFPENLLDRPEHVRQRAEALPRLELDADDPVVAAAHAQCLRRTGRNDEALARFLRHDGEGE